MRSPLRRHGVKAVLAGTAAVTALVFVPGGADADFTFTRCQGLPASGIGASFQENAQIGFIQSFSTTSSPTGCAGTQSEVGTYLGSGSGAGRLAFGAGTQPAGTAAGTRNTSYRYAAVDEAPTSAQRAQMEAGPDAGTGDDSKVRVIPVAVGAAVIAVNYPDNCTLPNGTQSTGTAGPGVGDQSSRLRLTAQQVEQVMGGDIATWGQLVTGIAAVPGNSAGKTNADCTGQRIRRIVRNGDSGTTFAVKQYLQVIRPTRTPQTWDALSASPNTSWPLSVNADGTPRADGTPVQVANGACTGNLTLCSAQNDSGGNLLGLAAATDGSFGYGDIAAARSRAFELTPTTYAVPPAAANADTTYWMPLQNISATGTPYFEPTSDPNGFRPPNNRGANCASATFTSPTGLPTDTLGDFSKVNAASSPAGYPLCVLTYMLAWDDYAPVYGTSDTRQREARTVRDFLDSLLTDTVQAGLQARDYTALPQTLLALARGGASQVNYAKSPTGGQPTATPTPSVAPTGTPTGSATPNPQVPSNQFTIQGPRVSKSQVISLSAQVPGRGVVSASAVVRSRGINIGQAGASPTAAGTVRLTIQPSKKLRNAIKKLPRNKSLKAAVSVAFTPSGGTINTQTRNVSIKGTKKPKKRRN